MTEGILLRLTSLHLNMVLWRLFTLSCIYGISEATLMKNHLQSREEFLEDRLLSAKTEMAKRFINNKRDSSELLNVSATEPVVFEVGFNGGSSFSAFSQVLILADDSIHTISDSEGSLKLHSVAKLPNLDSTVKLAFIKAVERRNILFILVALKSGYCKIYTATPSMNITQRQTIYIYGPQDAEFFSHANELFLIIISSKPESYNVPSYIYRWTGTHFDEVKTFLTRGAVAVSTFPFKRSVIITVAQYPKDRPTIGSQVFRWSNNGLERMQFLATNGPVAVQYLETHGESYLIIINDFEYSSVFWWTGREFVNWDSFNDAKGMNKISIGYTEDEPIILIANNDKITVYKLLENKLQRLTTVSLFEGEEILSMSLHMNVEPRLVVISRKYGILSTSIFHLQLLKGHIGDYIQKTDQLLQCFKNVIELLEIREKQTKVLMDESSSLLKLSENATLNGKLIVNGTVNIRNTLVGRIETYPHGIQLKRNILEINEKISDLTEVIDYHKVDSESLVQKSSPQSMSGKLHVQNDLIITNGWWDKAVLIEINGKTFKYEDMLRYGTDQVISGAVVLSNLTTAILNVTSLHGIAPEDFLLKGSNQTISGSHEIRELITRQLYIPQEHTINQIELSKLVTKDVHVVHGHKKLQSLYTQNLRAKFMNGENITNIEDKYVLKSGGEYRIEALTFLSDLIIEDVIVKNINGLEWDKFISEVLIAGENQNVNGSLIFANNLKIEHLFTKELNKSLVDDLMTCSTDQEILSVLEVNKIKAVDITGWSFNGINLNSDVALIGNVNDIKGSVNIKSAKVQNLTTTDKAEWFANWTGRNRKPVVSYKNKVVILGNIQVEDISLLNSYVEINETECELETIKDKYWNSDHQDMIMKEQLQIGNISIVGNMSIKHINGLDAKNLIHTTESEVINDITFEGLRIENGLDLKESINISGINLHEMNQTAVFKKGNYLLKGSKNFLGGLYTDNLQTIQINQKYVSNMISLEEEKPFLGKKSFSNIVIKKDLYVEDNSYVDILNSINISSKLPLALRIDESFSVEAMKLATVTAAKGIETITINQIHFDDLVKTINQETSTIKIKEVKINGDFEFLGDLEIERVNEIELHPYLKEVVDKRFGGEIRGKKTFLNEVVAEFLEAYEINGIDMIYLQQNALSKTKPQNITGYSTIKRIQSVNFVAQEINGKNMDHAIYISDANHPYIESNIRFSDITVMGDLNITKINSCDPTRVYAALYSSIKDCHMKELNVSKNLSWKFQNSYDYSLSNYFDKVVLQRGNNVIQGKVTFLDKVYSEFVTTKGVINGINLTAIADDCVIRSSMEQELYGQKIFINSINASRVEVKGNANIRLVNEIDIIETNTTLVRKSSEQEIYGYKHFLNEFQAEKLRCGGRVNGVSLSNIATINDYLLPPTEVNNLVVTEHLEVGLINKINLTEFLQGRVTCNDSQEIDSKLQFSDHVKLLGNTQTAHINYIGFEDIMRTNSFTPQRLTAEKIFEQEVIVNGNIQVSMVNGKNLEEAYRLGVQANEDTEVHGNLVFTNTVKINSDINGSLAGLEMSYKYNNIKDIYENITEELNFHISKIDHDIYESMELIKVIPREFAYLEYVNLTIQDMNIISATHHASGEDVAISLYGLSKKSCYLPRGCLCPSQYELQFYDDDGYTLILREDNKRLFKAYDLKRKFGAELVTNTSSYGNRCRIPLGEYEEFSIMSLISWNNETSSLTYNKDVDKYEFEGYISDVKSLSVGNSLYVAVAIYYDAILSSHNINSFVIELVDGESQPKLFQYIPTYGAKVLQLFHSQEGVYVFIGNSYDSNKRTNLVDSEIYRLNPNSNEFMLIRSLKTKGINSAETLILKNEKFIIVSQQFRRPLTILKYKEDYDNFYLYQTLYFEDTTVGVGSFYLEGNGLQEAFLGVAVTDGSFHLYKYSHIEGFKKIISSWQTGITGFIPIFTGKRQLIITPSEMESNILHVVSQGNDDY